MYTNPFKEKTGRMKALTKRAKRKITDGKLTRRAQVDKNVRKWTVDKNELKSIK